MSTDSSVSPDLRTALEALIAEWESEGDRIYARPLRALLVSHPPSPPPDELSFLRESLELFFGAIVQQYGTNDHAWLVRNARDTLKTLKQLPSPPGAGWRDIASHDGDDAEAIFWIVEKTSEEAGIEMPGNSIFGGGPSRMVLGPYGSWSSLSKATHWQPKPSPPAEESST